MSAAAEFLTTLAQAVATMNLYGDGHPARERALDVCHGKLAELQEEDPTPTFTFLGGEIVVGRRPLRELKHWDWGDRLAAHGIQRLEFIDLVTREDLECFLEEVHDRLSGNFVPSAEVRQGRPSAIRYGEVGLRGEDDQVRSVQTLGEATLDYSLSEEISAVEWLHGEVQDGRALQLVEAEGIVRSLSVAMHGDQAFLIPMVRLKEFDQYTVTHTLNVAVLTMALAEFLGLGPREVRLFGIAGLLHDLGKVAVPKDILNKPGKLTDEERKVMNRHTVEGARLILETEEHLDLAAVVAYEHHIRIDGGGYPSLRYPRACHHASNLVHVCDVFDALRTDRPYREAWPTERALKIIAEGAGPEFDAQIAHAFTQMMTRWEARVAEVDLDDPVLAGGRPDTVAGADAGKDAPAAPEVPDAAPRGGEQSRDQPPADPA